MKAPLISIVMGSDSDWSLLKQTAETLNEFQVPFEVQIMSAHRTPEDVRTYVKQLKRKGVKVVIAAAGKAAHLAGVVAAYTTLPVIGLPIRSGGLGGMDALLAMVQMPPGVPVATMAINGAKNAALQAVAILALSNTAIDKQLLQYREQMEKKVQSKNEALQEEVERDYGN